MTPHPSISVALVTRNRPDSLRKTLESLRAQASQPFEVIVSDDSDSDRAAATASVAREFDCAYAPGPRRGLYANRNAVALLCRGSHVRTMDDDHLFPKGHFESCQEAVASGPACFWSTGEIGFIDGVHHASVDRALELQPSGVGALAHDWDDNWAVADGSTIFPREVFQRGFRMIEEFGFGSSYLEFGALLYHCGYRGRCVRGAAVEHYAGRSTLTSGDNINARESRLFASICYNLYFQRNLVRAFRYCASHVIWHGPRLHLTTALPRLWLRARARWSSAPVLRA